MAFYSKINLPPEEEIKHMTLCHKGYHCLDNPALAEKIMNEAELRRLLRKYNYVTQQYDYLLIKCSSIDERDMSVEFEDEELKLPSWESFEDIKQARYGIICATGQLILIDAGEYSVSKEKIKTATTADILPAFICYRNSRSERNAYAAYRYLVESNMVTTEAMSRGSIDYKDILEMHKSILDNFHFQEELDAGIVENKVDTLPYVKIPLTGEKSLMDSLSVTNSAGSTGLADLADF